MSNVGTLPLEIITDILSQLPVKSLCRFKSVSLSWNSQISSPHFAKTHLDRTKTQKNPKHLDQKIFILTTNQNLHHKLIFSHDFYSVDFADAKPTATKLDFPTLELHATPDSLVEVWSSCDGLLLVSRQDNSHHVLKVDNYSFFLLNPSTRECKKLPMLPFAIDPARGALLSFHGVGYDSSIDDYKVLMIFGWADDTTYQSYRDSYVGVVVAYSRNTDSWRRIQDFPFMHVSRSGGVFFNGCINCLCWGRTGPTDTHVIVAFDWSDEIFKEVLLPAACLV